MPLASIGSSRHQSAIGTEGWWICSDVRHAWSENLHAFTASVQQHLNLLIESLVSSSPCLTQKGWPWWTRQIRPWSWRRRITPSGLSIWASWYAPRMRNSGTISTSIVQRMRSQQHHSVVDKRESWLILWFQWSPLRRCKCYRLQIMKMESSFRLHSKRLLQPLESDNTSNWCRSKEPCNTKDPWWHTTTPGNGFKMQLSTQAYKRPLTIRNSSTYCESYRMTNSELSSPYGIQSTLKQSHLRKRWIWLSKRKRGLR